MCNPRRIEVPLTRQVEQGWSVTLEEQATAHAEAAERIEQVVPLGLGATAQAMLRQALDEGFRGFVREGAVYVRERGPLRLVYNPEGAVLTITAERRRLVAATATARVEASGTARGQVEVVGQGMTYDDAPDEHTARVEAHARRDAEAQAERATHALVDAQSREARDAAGAAARSKARAEAEGQAATQAEAARGDLAAELRALFDASRPALREEIGALVAETMKRSVLQLVRANGGRIQENREDDDEIVIKAVL
jgi:hypothetical protein